MTIRETPIQLEKQIKKIWSLVSGTETLLSLFELLRKMLPNFVKELGL